MLFAIIINPNTLLFIVNKVVKGNGVNDLK